MSNLFNDRSKAYLTTEFKDAFHDFFVTVLDSAEKQLLPNKKSDAWQNFRFSVLNSGNQYIRLVDEILAEYYVEFRPEVFSVKYKDGNLFKPSSKVAEFIFSFPENIPVFSVVMHNKDKSIDDLMDIKEILQCGEIYKQDKKILYMVKGLYDNFHKVIPFLTKTLKGATLDKFNAWKEQVYELEGKGSK